MEEVALLAVDAVSVTLVVAVDPSSSIVLASLKESLLFLKLSCVYKRYNEGRISVIIKDMKLNKTTGLSRETMIRMNTQ